MERAAGDAPAAFRARIARRYDEVVELGCGTGFFTRTLAERAERVVATDSRPRCSRSRGSAWLPDEAAARASYIPVEYVRAVKRGSE